MEKKTRIVAARYFFSDARTIPRELIGKVEQVCSIFEKLEKLSHKPSEEGRALWVALENLLGIDVEVSREEIKDFETEQVIDSYNVYSVNQRPDSLFYQLCLYLPYLSTVDWYDKKEYLILTNGFVLELYGAGLAYSKDLSSISSQIIDELKRQDEYHKECEEEEKGYWENYNND